MTERPWRILAFLIGVFFSFLGGSGILLETVMNNHNRSLDGRVMAGTYFTIALLLPAVIAFVVAFDKKEKP
jgi:hypothetical protein